MSGDLILKHETKGKWYCLANELTFHDHLLCFCCELYHVLILFTKICGGLVVEPIGESDTACYHYE